MVLDSSSSSAAVTLGLKVKGKSKFHPTTGHEGTEGK
jgi:hypothetical protein